MAHDRLEQRRTICALVFGRQLASDDFDRAAFPDFNVEGATIHFLFVQVRQFERGRLEHREDPRKIGPGTRQPYPQWSSLLHRNRIVT